VKKLRVGVIYGGKSGEHEVSIASAASIIKHLDRDRYEAVPVHIAKDGRWALASAPTAISAAEVHKQARTEALQPVDPTTVVSGSGIDVVFPVLHGPYGEDGTIQGLLELANVPYVGSGVLGSAVGMDKAAMKTMFAAAGLPIVPHHVVLRREWQRDARAITGRVAGGLTYPVFVKPANLGSSVGVSKVKTVEQLADAVDLAFEYDRKIVIEEGLDAREIEIAMLGNDEPESSVPGEIVPDREFYDYDSKYSSDSHTELHIPARLEASQVAEAQALGVRVFQAVDASGYSRVDFLMDRKTGKMYVNEINTIPGFTSISMFPKLWEASGLDYDDLLSRLVDLGFERHQQRRALRTDYR